MTPQQLNPLEQALQKRMQEWGLLASDNPVLALLESQVGKLDPEFWEEADEQTPEAAQAAVADFRELDPEEREGFLQAAELADTRVLDYEETPEHAAAMILRRMIYARR